ncbi:MAG: hypothetical protein V1775_01070 [Bacteroidota bacterium]
MKRTLKKLTVFSVCVFAMIFVSNKSYSETKSKTTVKTETHEITISDSLNTDTVLRPVAEVTSVKSDNTLRQKFSVLFGDYIIMKVKNLDSFIGMVDSCRNKSNPNMPCPVILFINGTAAPDIRAFNINKDAGTITFKLSRDAPSLQKIHFELIWSLVKVRFSAGLETSGPIDYAPDCPNVFLKYITHASLIMILLMVLLMIWVFRWLILRTNLIRATDAQSKFSLSLAQLLFWVFLVALSFVYIWITTDNLYPITGSTLVLLSISLTTTGGSKLVDRARDPLRQFESHSESFFRDILSDDLGFSVHRVQMAIWTIILGIVFIFQVIVKQEMPQFDTNLLLLMGISSTGYVGLKSIENIKGEVQAKTIKTKPVGRRPAKKNEKPKIF